MKTREDILRALASNEEDKLLLATVFDKLTICRERGYRTNTKFLDLRQQELVERAIHLADADRESIITGGFPDAERKIAVFFPDYLTEQDILATPPISLLRATKHPQDTLAHRDYLGALMGLQMERSMLGDILLHDTGADLLLLPEMTEFVLTNFERAGKRRIALEERPLAELLYIPPEEIPGEGSIASMRLDNVIALIFHLPRSEAQLKIEKGQVLLNDRLCEKAEREIKESDRITLRGFGRAKICALGGVSRKGRLFLRYTRCR